MLLKNEYDMKQKGTCRGRRDKKEELKICTNFGPLALLFGCCCGVKGLGDHWLVVTGKAVHKKNILETAGGLNQSAVTVASILTLLLEGVERVPPHTDRGASTQTRLAEMAFVEEG